jgi:hypothetical protein
VDEFDDESSGVPDVASPVSADVSGVDVASVAEVASVAGFDSSAVSFAGDDGVASLDAFVVVDWSVGCDSEVSAGACGLLVSDSLEVDFSEVSEEVAVGALG